MSSINNVLPGGQPRSQSVTPTGQPSDTPNIDTGLYRGKATIDARTYSGGASTQYVSQPATDAAAPGLDAAAAKSAVSGGGSTNANGGGLTGLPATIDDFRALNIYTEPELKQLAEKYPTEKELGAQYDRTVAYYSTDQGQQELQALSSEAHPQAPASTQGAAATQAPDAAQPAGGGDFSGGSTGAMSGSAKSISTGEPQSQQAPAPGTATLQDLQATGMLTDTELKQLESEHRSPAELGQVYAKVIEYFNAPQGMQELAAAGTSTAGGTGTAAGTAAGPGAWSDQWGMKLRGAMASAGASPAVIEANIDGIKRAGYDEAGLTNLFNYLHTGQGKQDVVASEAAATSDGTIKPDGGPDGWNDAWADKFRSTLKAAGVQSAGVVQSIQDLKAMHLSDGELTQVLAEYQSPAGAQLMAGINAKMAQQDQAGVKANLMFAGAGVGVIGSKALFDTKMAHRALVKDLAQLKLNGAPAAEITAAEQALAKPSATLSAEQIKVAKAEVRTRLLARADTLKAGGERMAARGVRRAANSIAPVERMSVRNAFKYAVGGGANQSFAAAASGTGAAAEAATGAVRGGGLAAAEGAKVLGTAGEAAAGAGVKAATAGAGLLSRVGRVGMKALGPLGLIAGAGLGAWQISETVKAEGGFGKESSKATGSVVGGIAGGLGGMAAGALAGAAIGSVVPGIGTLIGGGIGLLGGLVGGILGSMGGEAAGGAIHDAIAGADQVKGK